MKSVLEKFIYAFICASVMLSLTGTQPVHAASFNVGTAVDLINAINTANSNGQADTITLTANITLTAVDNTTWGANGLPAIEADGGNALTINGNGFFISRSYTVGTPNFRLFQISNGAALALRNITLSNGSCASCIGGGGAILNQGMLNITNSIFSNNINSNGDGGAIANLRNLDITDSTFLNNSAKFGGAIGNIYIANITNSTFSNNSAWYGGAIYNQEITNITNSTFTDNSATYYGGGLVNSYLPDSIITVINSTLVDNGANNGGAIYNESNEDFILKNTILATSILFQNNCGGSFITAGVDNLATDLTCDSATPVTTNMLKLSPALANNGGPTQTLALLSGSAAIDAGNAATCANAPASGKDQRGVTRPQGVGCDVGAYEYGAVIPVVTASNPSAGATLTSLSSITVVFNQDMLDNATVDGAENVDNYILVERGANGSFDTLSCNGGVVSDDVQQTISTASYNSTGFITVLTLASSLPAGTYRLFVCGTTSIWSAVGLELNNGASDTTIDFTITGRTAAAAKTLPLTGFAPSTITSLPQQPAHSAYANLGDLWLEIPTLKVKSNIVGVSQGENNIWDVNWLGRDTGWLNNTTYPTWTGNSVITGHVYDASGLPGIFVGLKDLKKGDQVIVHMGGEKYIFQVQSSKLVRPDTTAFAFEHLEDNSYLTLITCAGYDEQSNSYLFRRLVRAVLVDVQSE